MGEISMVDLSKALNKYTNNKVKIFNPTSHNVLYSFLRAYQTTRANFVVANTENAILFFTASICLLYYIDECLNLLSTGQQSATPFVRINKTNKAWLYGNAAIRNVLLEMQKFLPFNVFYLQIQIQMVKTPVMMTDGEFNQIESICERCRAVLRLPRNEPINPIPSIRDVLNNQIIIDCLETISSDYRNLKVDNIILFLRHMSKWDEIKAQIIYQRCQKPISSAASVVLNDLELCDLFSVKKESKTTTLTNKKKRPGKSSSVKADDKSNRFNPRDDLIIKQEEVFDVFNPTPFEEVAAQNPERKYVFTANDYRTITHYCIEIVSPFRILFPELFVKEKIIQSGLYLNIFHKKPKKKYSMEDNIAHLSLHPIGDLYHFKINKHNNFNLPEPDNNKKYTISFKMHTNINGRLSATIQPFVNNKNTEVECPDQIIKLFKDMLDIMVAKLNENLGGVQTRRKNKNKNRRTKKRNAFN